MKPEFCTFVDKHEAQKWQFKPVLERIISHQKKIFFERIFLDRQGNLPIIEEIIYEVLPRAALRGFT
jgi:hypothetical protein